MVCLALAFLLVPGVVAAHAGVYDDVEARFPVGDSVSVPFELHQLVLHFAPGAVAALHRHGGPGYITMLEGELTLIADGERHAYRAGDSFVEVPEGVYEGWNGTDEYASLIVTYIVPEGHDVTTYIQGQASAAPDGPAPETVIHSVFLVQDAPNPYQVIHYIEVYEPDEWSTLHDERGLSFVTVVDGRLTARDGQGGEMVHQSGGTLRQTAGPGSTLGNSGSGQVTVAATLLVPASESSEIWSRPRQIGLLAAAGALGIAFGALMLRRSGSVAA